MAKKYKVTQKLNLNGQKISTSFSITMEASDLAAFLALLEGGYEVSEVIESNLTGASTLVANTNAHTQIGFVGEVNGYTVYDSLRPYSGAIHFKNTASTDDITAVLGLTNPFPLHPTEKPKKVTFKGYESVVVNP